MVVARTAVVIKVRAQAMAVDIKGLVRGMAAHGQEAGMAAALAPVLDINPADRQEAVAHALAGTAIPVAAVDINQARAQAVRAAAICARTAISVTVAMADQAAAIAEA